MPKLFWTEVKKLFRKVPSIYKHEFRTDLQKSQIMRVKILSNLMIALGLFECISDVLLRWLWKEDWSDFLLLDILLLLVSTVYWFSFNLQSNSRNQQKMLNVLVHALPFVILGWTAYISGIEYHYSSSFPTFIAALLIMCVVLIFRFRFTLLYVTFGTVLLYINIKANYELTETLLARYFAVLPIAILALMISRIMYLNKLQLTEDRIKLEQMNLSLQQAKATLEQKVTEKTQNLQETNIHLKKAKEKAEESDRLKGAFIQNLSHEIRTPMNGIIGYAQLLQDDDQDPDSRGRYLQYLIENCGALMGIIDDLLTISIIQSNKNDIRLEPASINNVISKVYYDLAPLSKKQGLSLECTHSLSDAESIILTEETKLTKVLQNLVRNAIKFTPEGEVHFGYKRIGDNLEFFVSDTGIGISEEKLQFVFDLFWQAENDGSRRFEGTGLGLAISQAFVKILGGDIRINSTTGKGTQVYFSIPYRPTDLLEEELKDRDFSDKVILVVDDTESNIFIIKTMLAELKATLLTAYNGLDAIKICKSQNIDLVLMDIRMPGISGIETTREIKTLCPGTKVIMQTAYESEENRAESEFMGCDDFLVKPLHKKLLLKIVKQYL